MWLWAEPHRTPGGVALAGTQIRAGLGSTFSSLTIDVGIGNVCSLRGSTSVSWGGTLSLLSGALDVASPINLAPSGPASLIVRDVVNSKGVTLSAGTFNALGTHHSLRLVGSLQTNVEMATDLLSDLPAADSLNIDVNSGAIEVAGDSAIGVYYLQLPANLFIYGGSLTVGPGAAVELASNGKGGNVLELAGSNIRHSIRGLLRTADSGDSILVSGSSVSIVGLQQPGDAALVGNLGIGTSCVCTISGVRGVFGNFSAGPGSVVSLSMGTVGPDQRIHGSMALNGTSFTLASNLEVMGGVAFNAGVLGLGSYNLQVSNIR